MKNRFPGILSGVVVILLFAAGGLHAQTRYVSDRMEITLRSGPGTQFKILELLTSGQAVQVLDAGPEWSRVRVGQDAEGWVLNRYLMDQPTARIQLERMERRHRTLLERSTALEAENTQLKARNAQLSEALAAEEKESEQLRQSYERLKADSAEFLSLQERYQKNAADLESRTERISQLEESLATLERNHAIRWFLAGGGLLLLGFLVGVRSRKKRSRSGGLRLSSDL
ncbi:MAG TPA: TIGR04211 family SH3 domain-containing protein [Desulfobacterales bacterium]